MNKILVPTDFSICANEASEFALELAELANAKVDFVHLISTPVDWVKLPLEKEKNYPETNHQIGQAKTNLNKWIKKAQDLDIDVSQSLIFNQGKSEINRHIENGNCDFVIMGTHGASGLQKAVIGSNAQQVIRYSNVPVLVLKKRVTKPLKNVLFVSDFKDIYKAAYQKIIHFADLFEAHIELLFVNTPDEFQKSNETIDNMDAILRYCNRTDSCTKNIINANSVVEGINEFANTKSIDLIAICTHGKSKLQQLFNPSITEKIADQSQLPLLSIKL